MKNLPFELLSHVFALTITRDSYLDQHVQESTNKPQATLSLVCRYWEQVAITSPQIWSYIHLSLETTEETLRRRLSLSGREPLDIRVNVGDDADVDSSKTFRKLYAIIFGSVDRWRSFVIQGIVLFNHSPRHWILKLLPNVLEAAYYLLIEDDEEGLEMSDSDEEGFTEYRFKPWTVAPKLRRFTAKTSGQFYFKKCPLVTEFAVSEMGEWWGGSADEHSWHDKWEEYLNQLTELCPQLEKFEISDLSDAEGPDPMGWTQMDTEWPPFSHLHTLNLDALNASSTFPILSKFNAPNLQNLNLGQIHGCLPVPLPSVALSIDPSLCRIRFDNSPLHAIKLFLEKVSQARELSVCISLGDALGLCGEWFNFIDERGDAPAALRERIIEDWTWIKENTRSVQWVLPERYPVFLLEHLMPDVVTAFTMMGGII
ncbi:hypothetical protein FRC05_001691 [Tulasnella sp. 425]|nr:hypothetical protein FRC05_001691 [Tulasnella sp. 425]